MSVGTVSKLRSLAFIALTTIICFAKSDGVTDEERGKVEEAFKKTHPNLETLETSKWDLADKITEEKLEKACRDVEVAVNPSMLTSYVNPTREKSLKEERVIPRAPVLFTVGGEKTIHVKLLNCTFSEMKFYLAQGNDKDHVFCMEHSQDGKFRLSSGPHEINKSGFAD